MTDKPKIFTVWFKVKVDGVDDKDKQSFIKRFSDDIATFVNETPHCSVYVEKEG